MLDLFEVLMMLASSCFVGVLGVELGLPRKLNGILMEPSTLGLNVYCCPVPRLRDKLLTCLLYVAISELWL